MKKDKTAKHLAEEHFFFKKPLTLEEEKILENSKYSRLINKSYKKTVDSIIENVTEGKPLKKEEIVPTKKRKRGIHIGLNKEELRELIDDVEIEFNLDLSNPSPFKFDKVDPVKLKDYIRKYANLYVDDLDTLEHINKIINSESLGSIDILYRLYNAAEL
jgi:hypothetical protein